MFLLVLYFPLINFLILGCFGRFLGTKGSNLFVIIHMFLNLIFSYVIFYIVIFNSQICLFKLFSWFNISLFFISWGCFFDALTVTMLIVVNTVSFFVHLYSIDYMSHDPFSTRFMSYLSLFTWFMLILITADNLLQLFVGWEGVGLVSYLLINFWFTIAEANKSSLKAMIMNRVGDIGLSLGLLLIYFEFKTLDFCIIFPLVKLFSLDLFYVFGYYINILLCISIFILIGAIGKSAQLGLHTWLPDAMAGPTPVSALIHAATMVTAGVFVLIRMSPLIEYSSTALFIITLVGILTAFFAATIGLFQNDIKKIIAYSTCSQLGYMVFICGLSQYSLSLFHLTNHAFFKALLFLSAGAVIHGTFDEQDIRKYGGLINLLPYSYIMICIGSFSLMGIPFLTGFYSKDLIIELSYVSFFFHSSFVYWLSVLSAFFTSLYSIRLLFFCFITKANGFKYYFKHAHDAPIFIFISLLVLGFFSIFFGFFLKDVFVGLGTDVFSWFFPISNQKNVLILESEFLPFYIKQIPFIFSLSGIFVIFFFNLCFNKIRQKIQFKSFKYCLYYFYSFFSYKWYIDVLYNKYIVKYFFHISYSYLKNIDRGLIELFGPLGIIRFISFFVNFFKFLQTGLLYNYMFLFLLFFCFYFFFSWNFFIFDLEFFFIFLFLMFFLTKVKI
jgi:NADH-ubiquinone oxidoreductase chain 5